MPRHYPPELHVGQKVMVHPSPADHAIEAVVTFLDTVKGLVHVAPVGSNIKWAARPRAISSPDGFFLHFEKRRFTFKETPCFT